MLWFEVNSRHCTGHEEKGHISGLHGQKKRLSKTSYASTSMATRKVLIDDLCILCSLVCHYVDDLVLLYTLLRVTRSLKILRITGRRIYKNGLTVFAFYQAVFELKAPKSLIWPCESPKS